jgi:predicted signal transduction protein with EAL and GGDEF domain
VAEGVETAELWDRVAELGCDVAQGYHISRPLPADQVAGWMAGWRPRIPERSSSNGSPRAGSRVAAAQRR